MTFGDFPSTVFISSEMNDGDMLVNENQKKFLAKLKLSSENLIVTELEHHDNISIVFKKDMGEDFVGDALITTDKNLFLGILTADCLPIGIFDSKTQLISLIHASVNNYKTVINRTITLLKQKFNSKTQNLIVEINPSIGSCHYKMDLWNEVESLLIKNGTKKENITNHKICTYENNYFSHRRSENTGEPEKRLLTILGLK